MPWDAIEKTLRPSLARKDRKGRVVGEIDLFGPTELLVGAGVAVAGRPRLPVRLLAGLRYLKHAFNESDESVVAKWRENPYWQFFCGNEYFETRLACDAGSLTRFRDAIGEAGVEELLAQSIETAVSIGAIKSGELQRVIVDSTVQEKAIAFPTDSRLLDKARDKLAQLARKHGIGPKRTYEKEGT